MAKDCALRYIVRAQVQKCAQGNARLVSSEWVSHGLCAGKRCQQTIPVLLRVCSLFLRLHPEIRVGGRERHHRADIQPGRAPDNAARHKLLETNPELTQVHWCCFVVFDISVGSRFEPLFLRLLVRERAATVPASGVILGVILGIMENRMETTIGTHWGNIGVVLGQWNLWGLHGSRAGQPGLLCLAAPPLLLAF